MVIQCHLYLINRFQYTITKKKSSIFVVHLLVSTCSYFIAVKETDLQIIKSWHSSQWQEYSIIQWRKMLHNCWTHKTCWKRILIINKEKRVKIRKSKVISMSLVINCQNKYFFFIKKTFNRRGNARYVNEISVWSGMFYIQQSS